MDKGVGDSGGGERGECGGGGSGVGRGEGVKGGVKGDRSSLPTGVFLKAGIALWGGGFCNRGFLSCSFQIS